MTFKEYQEKSYVSIKPHQTEREIVFDWMIGLTEEVGEVASIIKHGLFHNEEINNIELAKELSDCLWYISALAFTFNLNLDAIAKLNLAKLEHRFGGNTFNFNDSSNRHEKELNFKETPVYKEIIEELKNVEDNN